MPNQSEVSTMYCITAHLVRVYLSSEFLSALFTQQHCCNSGAYSIYAGKTVAAGPGKPHPKFFVPNKVRIF